MAGAQRDRNIKIGSGKKKSTSSTESTGWSRPAEGRRDTSPPKKITPAQTPSPRRNDNRRSNDNRRGNTNQQGGRQGNRSSRPQQKSPLMEELWARVIDQDLVSNLDVALS